MPLDTDRQEGYVRLKPIIEERRLLSDVAKTPKHEGSVKVTKATATKDEQDHHHKPPHQHGQGNFGCHNCPGVDEVWANRTSESWLTDDAGRAAEIRTVEHILLMCMALFVMCVGVMFYEKRKQRKAAELKAQTLTAAAENPALEDGNSTSCAVDPVSELEGMDRVREELSKVRLEQYTNAFEEAGYDHWPEIQKLPQSRFFKMRQATKMSKNHADRLEELLSKQRQALGVSRVKDKAQPGMEDEQCAIL